MTYISKLNFGEKLALASDPDASDYDLIELYDSGFCDYEIKCAVLGRKKVPDIVMRMASNDTYYYIRIIVTCIDMCPIDIIEKLSNDTSWAIRRAIAIRSDCPVQILEKLSNDHNNLVRYQVKINKNATHEMINNIENIDMIYEIHEK